jgi:hypothetical protein
MNGMQMNMVKVIFEVRRNHGYGFDEGKQK